MYIAYLGWLFDAKLSQTLQPPSSHAFLILGLHEENSEDLEESESPR